METQRDCGYYGVVKCTLIDGQSVVYNLYKDRRNSLYKTEKPLMNRLKAQVDWCTYRGNTVTEVKIVQAKVFEVVTGSTLVKPDDLK